MLFSFVIIQCGKRSIIIKRRPGNSIIDFLANEIYHCWCASPAFINISRFGNIMCIPYQHPYFSGNITSLFLLSLLQNKNLLKRLDNSQQKQGKREVRVEDFSKICKEAESFYTVVYQNLDHQVRYKYLQISLLVRL